MKTMLGLRGGDLSVREEKVAETVKGSEIDPN